MVPGRQRSAQIGPWSAWMLVAAVSAHCAVCVRMAAPVPEPTDAQPVSHRVAFALFEIDIQCTAGEQWQAVEFTLLGKGLKPEHFRAPAPGVTDKHERLRDRSGFGVFQLTHDDAGFLADNAQPAQNEKPVTLDSAESVDLSAWPRVCIRMPETVAQLPPPQRFAIAARLAKTPPPQGLRFRARLERLQFSRNTPWLDPVVAAPRVVDCRPPTLSLTLNPEPPVQPGASVILTVAADEPLAAQPQVLFHPNGEALRHDNRGRLMPETDSGKWRLTLTPRKRLTPNRHPEQSTARYTLSIPPIARYADDGVRLFDGECRPSWFAAGALQWRNLRRVDVLVDLGDVRMVEALRVWVPYLNPGTLELTCATAAVEPGPWSEEPTQRLAGYGRSLAFSIPLNRLDVNLSPREARFVRFTFTGHASPQITEIEVLGDSTSCPTGPWDVVVRAWDRAWNYTVQTLTVEVTP